MQHKAFTAPLEIKNLDEGGSFEGYASVFGVMDSDGDVIVKGAFRKSIEDYRAKGKMPKMLWQHNPSIIVGKFTDMEEDDYGLRVKGTLILEVEKGREAYALMKAGELDAMSVGFNIDEAQDGNNRGRVISAADLWEVSLVTWGANPDAKITTVKCIDTVRDFERFLRDSGFSRKQAVAITAGGFKAVDSNQSESDDDDIAAIQSLIKTLKGA
jgi:HK97 family phage prohead protease